MDWAYVVWALKMMPFLVAQRPLLRRWWRQNFSIVRGWSFAFCVGVWFSLPPRIHGGSLTYVGLFVGGMPYSVAAEWAICYSLLRCSQEGSFFLGWRRRCFLPVVVTVEVRGPPVSKAKDHVQLRVYSVDGRVSCPLFWWYSLFRVPFVRFSVDGLSWIVFVWVFFAPFCRLYFRVSFVEVFWLLVVLSLSTVGCSSYWALFVCFGWIWYLVS